MLNLNMKSKLKIEQIGEFGLIAEIKKMLHSDHRVVKGIGDDCAVLHSTKKGWYDLLTIDTIFEGVHFNLNDAPEKIGWKAMAVNISDIAAMGGIPAHAVVSLGIPDKYTVAKIHALYRGIRKAALKFSINIVGGDTIRSPERLVVTVALIGSVEKSRIALRSGAKPGDVIYLTGDIGGSILGRHLTFSPRLLEARFLVQNFKINSMIDLSDGLASDMRRIMEESKVGAVINAQRIPVSLAARKNAVKCGKKPIECALTDGEDFELLFTVRKKAAKMLEIKWKQKFNLKLTEIGEITKRNELKLKDKSGRLERLNAHGYDHFG